MLRIEYLQALFSLAKDYAEALKDDVDVIVGLGII